MTDAIARFTLDGFPCCVHAFGSSPAGTCAPLFIMPFSGDATDSMQGQHMRLDALVDAGTVSPFMLAVFETPNWDDDLSPWPAKSPRRGGADFGGGAQATLDWILGRFIPAVERHVPLVLGGVRGLLGYSMAGMFALWAIHQTDVFALCASCSGSLWYDGFSDYIEQNTPKTPCSVYLSLGEMEEKTHNPWFAKVGSATRRAAALMAASPVVQETALVWHPGGHTGYVGERLAAAQGWMAKRCVRL